MDTRSLRIALLLLVIYLAGLATGRYLIPPKTELIYSRGIGPSGAGDPLSANRVIELLKSQCEITPEQVEKIRPILIAWRQEARKYPPQSRPVIDLWEECAAKIGKELTADQQPAYRRLTEDARRRIARRFNP